MGYKYPYRRRLRKSPITKELQRKHALGLTLSPLDLCLRKDLITSVMHRAGNHLIFLHSARFGMSYLKGHISNCYQGFLVEGEYTATEEDLIRIQAEYKRVAELLQSLKAYDLVLDVCIYNSYPSFLKCIGELNDWAYDELLLFKSSLQKTNKLMVNLVRRRRLI